VQALQPKAYTIFVEMAAGGDISFDEAFTRSSNNDANSAKTAPLSAIILAPSDTYVGVGPNTKTSRSPPIVVQTT